MLEGIRYKTSKELALSCLRTHWWSGEINESNVILKTMMRKGNKSHQSIILDSSGGSTLCWNTTISTKTEWCFCFQTVVQFRLKALDWQKYQPSAEVCTLSSTMRASVVREELATLLHHTPATIRAIQRELCHPTPPVGHYTCCCPEHKYRENGKFITLPAEQGGIS